MIAGLGVIVVGSYLEHLTEAQAGPLELLRQRENLRQEIEELGKLTRRYGRLAESRNQLQRELTRLEEANNRTEHQARVVELAITLRDRWSRRAALEVRAIRMIPVTGTSSRLTIPK